MKLLSNKGHGAPDLGKALVYIVLFPVIGPFLWIKSKIRKCKERNK